jgi:hypothetical protein
MTTYRALVDLSTARAGETFEADDDAVGPALAFGLVEAVEDDDDPKPKPKRSTTRRKATS